MGIFTSVVNNVDKNLPACHPLVTQRAHAHRLARVCLSVCSHNFGDDNTRSGRTKKLRYGVGLT